MPDHDDEVNENASSSLDDAAASNWSLACCCWLGAIYTYLEITL